MRNQFFNRRRAERFAQLLEEANGARRHHVRTRHDGELSGLVEFAHRVRTDPPVVEVDPEFRADLRAMLIATAQREGVGRTATGAASGRSSAKTAAEQPRLVAGAAAATPGQPGKQLPTGRLLRPLLTGQSSRVRARGAIVLGVAVGAIAVSGMSAASENAVPGDALYGMKRSTERAQLALATSDLNRGQLFLDFARTRLTEAQALHRDSASFAAVLDDMDDETRQGVRLLTTAAMQRNDRAPLDAIAAFLDSHRRQVVGLIDAVGTRAQRLRIERSLTLLDLVAKRAEGLRTALACGAGASTHADALGPSPRACVPQAPLTPPDSVPGLERSDDREVLPAESPQTAPGGSEQQGGATVTPDEAPGDFPGGPEDALPRR